MLIILGLLLELICCGFAVVSLFRLLKLDYFNPIVKLFTENLEPISKKIFFFMSPLLASITFSIFLRLTSLKIIYPDAIIMQLLFISIFLCNFFNPHNYILVHFRGCNFELGCSRQLSSSLTNYGGSLFKEFTAN